jgi:anaerobic selenocysteine-containing dehydrogenase
MDPLHPPLHPTEEFYRNITRRQFFDVSARTMSAAMGAMGLAGLAGPRSALTASQPGSSCRASPISVPRPSV